MALSNLINAWVRTQAEPAAETKPKLLAKKIKKMPDLPSTVDPEPEVRNLQDPTPNEQPTPVAVSARHIGMNRPHARIWRNNR